MAQVIEKRDKDGNIIKYLIRVSAGYDIRGIQKKKNFEWKPPEGLTPSKLKKALDHAVADFEKQVADGSCKDGNIKFSDFLEEYMRIYGTKELKQKTLDGYNDRLSRISAAIGHMKLKDIKTGHINDFYANLGEDGIRKDAKFKSKVNLAVILKKQKLTRAALSEKSDAALYSVRHAVDGKNVDRLTAERIAKALDKKVSSIFSPVDESAVLSSSTIRTYHRTLSSIFGKAVKWGYLTVNPCTNAELPKMPKSEAAYLDEEDAYRLLELLQGEQMNYRCAVTFDLLSGLRRGELLGLRWQDIHFDSDTISVNQTLNYSPSRGLYIDTPKNTNSNRRIRLAHSLFLLLNEYKVWQDDLAEKCGDQWQNKDNFVFTSLFGAPINPDALSSWFKNFIRENDFPDVHFHSLRHTYASLMIADGTPLVIVSRRMGHAQVSTTSNIYSHVISSADEKAAQITDRFSKYFLQKDKLKQA